MERVDEAYLNEILSSIKNEEDQQSDEGSFKPKAGDVKVITDAISYEEILDLVCYTNTQIICFQFVSYHVFIVQ